MANPYMANLGMTRTGAPSEAEAGAFASMMDKQDFSGAASYARNLGYSNNDIAAYVGAKGFKENGVAIPEANALAFLEQGNKPTFYQNNQGMEAPKVGAYEKNPYLDEMAKNITSQMNDNWTRNLAPSIRSGAMAAGGFGGSRQGVVEANALNDMNRSLGQNLTQFYGQDWTNDRNRNLQKYGMDQSYNLGMANNNLGFANLDSNNAQFGQRFGLDVLNSQNAWANNGVAAANQIQQQPLNYFNNTNANTMAAAGTGQPNQVAAQGNPWMAGAGAGLATYGALTNGINNHLRTTSGP